MGAVAPQLQSALAIGNTRLGLLATISTAVAAVATLPLGALSDRVDRTRLLTGAVLVWSLATIVSGTCSTFGSLLATRLALGAVAATSGPVITSLVGDLFPPVERGRVYGFVLTGELLGSGVGFLVSGEVAALFSWRAAFWVLGALGLVVAGLVRGLLWEPERGGAGRLAAPEPAAAVADGPSPLQTVLAEHGVRPREDRVLREDPAERSLWWAVRHTVSIRTNLLLMLAAALGYFFFAGLRTFAVVFTTDRFHLSHAAATGVLVLIGLGAVVGTQVTGRLGDRSMLRGHPAARPTLAGLSLLLATTAILLGLLTTDLVVAAPLFFLGAMGFAGANPPLDAARLDLLHHRLWGRAQAVASLFRAVGEAAAPVLFGLVSVAFVAAPSPGSGGTASGAGLAPTFLVMLVPVALAGLLLCFPARRSYPRDAATAAEGVGGRH